MNQTRNAPYTEQEIGLHGVVSVEGLSKEYRQQNNPMGDPKCYFPERYLDEEYNYDPDEGPLTLSCRYCGEANLHWEATEEEKANVFSGWRLFDSTRRLHTCKKYKK